MQLRLSTEPEFRGEPGPGELSECVRARKWLQLRLWWKDCFSTGTGQRRGRSPTRDRVEESGQGRVPGSLPRRGGGGHAERETEGMNHDLKIRGLLCPWSPRRAYNSGLNCLWAAAGCQCGADGREEGEKRDYYEECMEAEDKPGCSILGKLKGRQEWMHGHARPAGRRR